MNSVKNYTFKIGEKDVIIETGKMARSAGGAVTVTCGDTVLLVTACSSENPRPGIDFFPLLVDFEEKMYSVGRIPGGYIRKEGRASDKAILTSRLIDRPVRPLFPKGYRNDVQVVATVLSSDESVQPDTLAMLGASTALMIAPKIPFEGPIGAVRVSKIDGRMIANPTHEEVAASDLDIVVSGTEESVLMVEAGCKFVSEEDILEAVEFAQTEIKKQVEMQKAFAAQCGVVKQEFVNTVDTSELKKLIEEVAYDGISDAYHNFDREYRKQKLDEMKNLVKEKISELAEDHPVSVLIAGSDINYVAEEFKAVEKKIMRAMIINEGVRADGRNNTEIRPVSSEVGLLPRAHGSGLFTRGSTQVLSVATLASPGAAQELDGIDPQKEKKYIHHYNFPGYSVGEVKPMRGAGRREIGHGNLAERAIIPALPDKMSFPYTVRVSSECIESNGSTSMASTCGSCLALMDAGVPLKAVIGGVAMGLIKEDDKAVVLTDIQGIEDFLGDMDFKVTGDKEGITALQMDMKARGISLELLRTALQQAKDGRIFIINKMLEAIEGPREEMSQWAPRIDTMKIPTDSIGTVIGPGGKTIRSIVDETGATIDIEDDGTVMITSNNAEGSRRAREIISTLTRKLTAGLILKGKVARIIPIGALVELGGGKDGLVHISQIAKERVNKVEDVLSLGQEVIVKVTGVDEKGRVNLSIKALTEEEIASME